MPGNKSVSMAHKTSRNVEMMLRSCTVEQELDSRGRKPPKQQNIFTATAAQPHNVQKRR
jgi:hypothetical protein